MWFDSNSFRRVATTWESWARLDPLYSILSASGTEGGRWELDKFFATGQEEIEELIERCDSARITFPRGVALDFGCGAGRLTRALADHFELSVGVDVSPTMIELARRYTPDRRCSFRVNLAPDLGLFPNEHFDFIYSSRVLQHIEPVLVLGYVAEFCRILRGDGVMVIHMPSSPAELPWNLKGVLRRVLGRTYHLLWSLRRGTTAIVEMHHIPKADMLRHLADCGMEVLLCEDRQGGPRDNTLYYCKKPSGTGAARTADVPE